MISPRASLFALTTVAVLAASGLHSEAALLVHEPFNYAGITGIDENGDGKKDLMDLNGGFGWGSAWLETTLSTNRAAVDAPRDFIQEFSLTEPSGDPRFSSGGSLHVWVYDPLTAKSQTSSRLKRSFAEPIVLAEESEVWFSVLLRKDSEVRDSTGAIRPTDRIEISLISEIASNTALVTVRDPTPAPLSDPDWAENTSFSIDSPASQNSFGAYLKNRGPNLGNTDLLVLRLSLEPGKNKLELFLNPSLDSMPTVADLTLPLVDGVVSNRLEGIQILSGITPGAVATSPTWSVDEIRLGTTYADVVPEPSSLLLTGLGVTMLGGARLRRSRVSLS